MRVNCLSFLYISGNSNRCFKSLFSEKIHEYQSVCQDFVSEIIKQYPEHGQRIKVHILLHLPDNIRDFSHPSCYNTERFVNNSKHCADIPSHICRFEAFNSFIRSQNVFANRRAPSRDIGHKLSIIEYLRFLCSSNQ